MFHYITLKLVDVVRLIAELDEEITQGFEINWIHYDDLCAIREILTRGTK